MRDPYLIALVWLLAANLLFLAVWCVVFWRTARAAEEVSATAEELKRTFGGMRRGLSELEGGFEYDSYGGLRLAGLDETEPTNGYDRDYL